MKGRKRVGQDRAHPLLLPAWHSSQPRQSRAAYLALSKAKKPRCHETLPGVRAEIDVCLTNCDQTLGCFCKDQKCGIWECVQRLLRVSAGRNRLHQGRRLVVQLSVWCRVFTCPATVEVQVKQLASVLLFPLKRQGTDRNLPPTASLLPWLPGKVTSRLSPMSPHM